MTGAWKPPPRPRHRAAEMRAGRRHCANAGPGGRDKQAALGQKYLPSLRKFLRLADFKHRRRAKGKIGNEKSERAETHQSRRDYRAAPGQPSQKFLSG